MHFAVIFEWADVWRPQFQYRQMRWETQMPRYILSSKKMENMTHFYMATEIIESAVLTNSRYEKEDDYFSHRFFFLLFEIS